MVKLPRWLAKLNFFKSRNRHSNDLQYRFIIGVLAPPFIVLLILGFIIIVQVEKVVRAQAIDELKRASSATSVKLEREFAIRRTVLSRTGEELFVIKSSYQTSKQTLDQNRATCYDYVKQNKSFSNAPNGACNQFLADFAKYGTGSLRAVEEGYARSSDELLKNQNERINERLSAYKQFFPETIALLVIDDKQNLVSSALSGDYKDSTDPLKKIAVAAQTVNAEGQVIKSSDLNLVVFAYPISGGSVLAAYDLGSETFIQETWNATPIDKAEALALILDSGGQASYPSVDFAEPLKNANTDLRLKKYITVSLKGIKHIALATEVSGDSKWLVAVASPAAAVLAPVRDAQLVAVVIIGTLLVGFLWVGTFFIRRTTKSIAGLVGGAMIFAGGNLDYKIQLNDADEEFISLADTLNKMAARIAAAEKSLDEKNKEFISVATHELRTPLTAIIGNLSMVYDDMSEKLDVEIKPMIEQAYAGTKRLKSLVNDLLDVARLEGGRQEFNIKIVQTQILVSVVVEALQITAREKGILLRYQSLSVGDVMADEGRLGIILNNFVSNAIKYNRPNGSVTLSHQQKDNKLITAIADTGLGIPDDQKAHMFEKFFRVQNEDRKNVIGTGLGMYITRQYIIAMGGELWFESTHGQGTTFYFSLPLANQNTTTQTPKRL